MRAIDARESTSETKIMPSIKSDMSICVMYERKLTSSPVFISPAIIILPPNHREAMIVLYTVICMTGQIHKITFSAETCARLTPSAEDANFSHSNFPRTKAFTTRIAMRFS